MEMERLLKATVQFKVSAENTDTVSVAITRLIHGDEHPDGPGFVEVEVPAECTGEQAVRRQFVDTGNAVVVDDPEGLSSAER